VIPPLVGAMPGVLVGRERVKNVNLAVGQEAKIVSPLGQDTPLGPVPRTKPYRVAGVFYTGMYEYDLKWIYVELGSLQAFLDIGDQVSGIEVRVQDPEETDTIMRAIRAELGPRYRVQDWKELNRSLFSALKLEKIAMFLVLAIIILVASFSIVGNLIMVVVEKGKEIAVLKTLGSSDRGVMLIFLIQGFYIGLTGTAIGVSLGLAVCWLGLTFGLPLDPNVYYIDRLPIHVEPLSVLAVAAAGLVISALATLYPAFVASRLRPVRGLRDE
jgi:lipoprotein-releasing system permease protein